MEIDGSTARSVEENASLTITARAIDAAGDTVPDAIVVWELLAPDSGVTTTGFDIDSLTGIVQASSPGHGRIRARVDDLRSDTISIVVTGAPDSIAADGDLQLTMASDADVSPLLATNLFDLTTDPDTTQPIADKIVTFVLIHPTAGSATSQGFFLTEQDTVPGLDPHTLAVSTDGTGSATVSVRRVAGATLPDSAVVHAVSVTAVGDTVAGSPLRFVVVFESGQ